MKSEELTARHLQVISLLRQGCSAGQIGAEMGISSLTVKRHLQRIAERLGVAGGHGQNLRILEKIDGSQLDAKKLKMLSPCERDYVPHIISATPYAEIGKRFGVTDMAIKQAAKRIFDKLGCGSRAELRFMLVVPNSIPLYGNFNDTSSVQPVTPQEVSAK